MIADQEHNTKQLQRYITSILLVTGFGYVLVRACIEFYNIAWGSGDWWGEFSLKWAAGFFAFSLFALVSWLTAVYYILSRRDALASWDKHIFSFLKKLGLFRWIVILALLVFPVWFLQYTPWGIVFKGLYFRLFVWVYVAFALAIFLRSGEHLLRGAGLLAALLLTSSAFSIAAAMINVSDYPFSLGWSEGNRMWDYSIMFGRHMYDYPPDQNIYVLLDGGRQFIGGIPFLVPGVTIQMERLWVGLTSIFPYLLLGFAAFRFDSKNKILWVLLAFWTFIFLRQGPIHPPLVLCAFVVALLWRSPLWLGIPMIFATGYFAEESRFTWLFAPAIWIVMLEFSGAVLENRRIQKTAWQRAAVLGMSGAVGGYFGAPLVNWVRTLVTGGEPVSIAGGAVSVSSVATSVSVQPLLWYRLFPNATYGVGILLALVIAIAPTLAILVYLFATRKWVMNTWQKLGIIFPLLAFLVVGLVVSTKIGGGGDLHNLDMFLIGIFFTAVIAWENGGRTWLVQLVDLPLWVKGTLVLLMAIPGIQPLSALRSLNFAEDRSWLVTLTDVADEKFLEMLPPQEEVDEILQAIRLEVDVRKSQGEVLFLDQRQLLTFGYIQDIPLVPEYEKKILMNEAMAASADYFSSFYGDLEARRYSLIISEPLRAPVKDSNYQFGEENNAWVKWVVEPVLCFYEEIETFRSVQIQLLVPKQGDVDCSSRLPVVSALSK